LKAATPEITPCAIKTATLGGLEGLQDEAVAAWTELKTLDWSCDALVLEMEGDHAPCPPKCTLRDTFKLKKQDVEEL